MVRMLVLEYYGDLSDRQVHEEVGYNLLYRSFVGLTVDEGVPDDTTLVTFRARIGEEGTRTVFELLNQRWEAAGLIDSQRRILDGCHLWAKVARRSWVTLMRQGRALVVDAVKAVDRGVAERLRGQFVPPAEEREPHGEQALKEERERTRQLLAAVAGLADERVRERAGILETMLGEADRPVSFVDTDARWGHKSKDKIFCGYKTHEAMDPESRMVTSVDVVAGNANEAARTDELLAKESTPLAEGTVIIGDSLYNKANTIEQVEDAGARPCFSGLTAERVSDNFTYEADADQMVCPEGKRSVGKVRVNQGDLYYFSMSDCRLCPLAPECLTRGERRGKAKARRRVYLSDARKRRVVAGEAGRQWRRQNLRLRYRIEAKFDEQMNRHGLRRARYWGLAKVTVQVLLNLITVNMKRAAKLLAIRGGPMPAPAAVLL
jgi:IS5 family transposase